MNRHKILVTFIFIITLPWFSPILAAKSPLKNDKTHKALAGVAESTFDYLQTTMDEYHNAFDIYTDQGAAGNHFNVYGMVGNSVSMAPCRTDSTQSGSTSIYCTFQSQGLNYGGYCFLNGTLTGSQTEPQINWGDAANAGFNLSGATTVTFYAKGESGGEKVEFFVGGIGWAVDSSGDSTVPNKPYPDTFPKVRTGIITLTNQWTQYTISLLGKNLSYVIGGFGWVAAAQSNNYQNIAFYLDNIRWDKSRLGDLRLLHSFETNPTQETFDATMRNVAFTYDNALALLAFLARGTSEDLNRAAILADSLVYAVHNDRYYTGTWLRNAYMAGDLKQFPGWTPNNHPETARMPGLWDCEQLLWLEDSFQVSTHTGNIGWVMIALITSYRMLGNTAYLQAVLELGEFVETRFRDDRGDGGYNGGYDGWEPTAATLLYKSTEHNLDLYVAFKRLYTITGEDKWRQRALHAENFITSMWDAVEGKFYTGTDATGVTPNQEFIPLDAQTWAVLALKENRNLYLGALAYAEAHHRVGNGFDFNTDQDGIWYEGTAQMAAAYNAVGEPGNAAPLLTELENAQLGSGAVPAASIDGLTTGLYLPPPHNEPWLYYLRGHVGASAWYVFAKLNVNPYWLGDDTSNHPDFNLDGKVDILWRHQTTGKNLVWYMDGTVRTRLEWLLTVADTNWKIGALGDINNDGSVDLLWRNSTTGKNLFWFMTGAVRTSLDYTLNVNDADWQMSGTGDFNKDGKTDLLWRHQVSGQNLVWFMDGVTRIGQAYLPDVADLNWQLSAVGDMDNNSSVDVIWRNKSDGKNLIWYMDGVTRIGMEYILKVNDVNWELCGTGDFNKNGKTDLLWRHKVSGKNLVWTMNGAQRISSFYLTDVTDTDYHIVN